MNKQESELWEELQNVIENNKHLEAQELDAIRVSMVQDSSNAVADMNSSIL